jgi:hypothetical protein
MADIIGQLGGVPVLFTDNGDGTYSLKVSSDGSVSMIGQLGGVPVGFVKDSGSNAYLLKINNISGGGASVIYQSQTVTRDTQVSTNSTSLVDLTDMSITLTTTGGDLLILFSDSSQNNTSGQTTRYAILVDGVQKQAGTFINGTTGAYPAIIQLHHLEKSLSSGSHTVKIQWRVGGGTGYSNTEANENARTRLSVIEIGAS